MKETPHNSASCIQPNSGAAVHRALTPIDALLWGASQGLSLQSRTVSAEFVTEG